VGKGKAAHAYIKKAGKGLLLGTGDRKKEGGVGSLGQVLGQPVGRVQTKKKKHKPKTKKPKRNPFKKPRRAFYPILF